MTKAIIIEDEKIAAESLRQTITLVDPDIEIINVIQSVEESVDYLSNNPQPDLIFMDIHLADGSAFMIFDKVEVQCPIIFTTAYDEFALKAFEVNSIDYLLKPIIKEDLERALKKFNNFSEKKFDYSKLFSTFAARLKDVERQYKSFFLMPERDKLIPLSVNDIAYIFIDEKVTKVVTTDNKSRCFSQNLDEVMQQLDPMKFFRANRQYIVSHKAIKDITLWFGNKISLNLTVPTPEKIIVSKARVTEFKAWFSA